MREIKFRAWREGNPYSMIYNPLHRCDAGNVLDKKEIYKDWILMQYTGLKDKDGVEIYEGDILNYQDKYICKVEWKNGGFVFMYTDGVENIASESWYAPSDVKITEVIGNIYQNKELLN